jgi:hypothetical protein
LTIEKLKFAVVNPVSQHRTPHQTPALGMRASMRIITALVLMIFLPAESSAQLNNADAKSRAGFSVLESTERNSTQASGADAGKDIDKFLTRLVLSNIPHTFEETKDWGAQDERWDGIEFRREGLKIETNRRKKMVNHGTWKKYSAELLNPNEEFAIEVKNMHETHDEKLAFDTHFIAHLGIHGRQSKWIKGVQLYSISADGHANVRLVVSIELEVKADFVSFPPDLVFVPRVTQADLVVEEFRLDRISKAGGEFAQQVTKNVRSQLDKKIDEKKQKLVDKINKQLAEKQDQLRLSIRDAAKSKWTKTANRFLPPSVQQALAK